MGRLGHIAFDGTNWIDLGTIMYPYDTEIIFDSNLTRLVDWDLLLSLAQVYEFRHINAVLSVYNMNVNPHSISIRESFANNLDILRDKWKDVYA